MPLVLHGASSIKKEIVERLKGFGVKLENAVGVSDENIKRAIKLGIRKINTDTDLQLAMMLELRKELSCHPDELKLYKILGEVRTAMEREVIKKIKLFNSK